MSVVWLKRPGELLHPEDCAIRWVDLLVKVGLAESKTEASRLLRSGSIEIRDYFCSDTWWERVSLDTPIPQGYPLIMRRGRRYYGIVGFFCPVEGQTLDFWSHFLEDENYNFSFWRHLCRSLLVWLARVRDGCCVGT